MDLLSYIFPLFFLSFLKISSSDGKNVLSIVFLARETFWSAATSGCPIFWPKTSHNSNFLFGSTGTQLCLSGGWGKSQKEVEEASHCKCFFFETKSFYYLSYPDGCFSSWSPSIFLLLYFHKFPFWWNDAGFSFPFLSSGFWSFMTAARTEMMRLFISS